jgi:hypothetical protein
MMIVMMGSNGSGWSLVVAVARHLRVLAGCLALFVALVALANPTVALESDYIVVPIRFLPSESEDVDGYYLYVLEGEGKVEGVSNIGLIEPQGDGVVETYIGVKQSIPYTISMSAYNQYGESERSNSLNVAALSCDVSECDDGDPCTIDQCAVDGCWSIPVPDGAYCDDGDPNTENDSCSAGICEGAPIAICLDDLECDDDNVCNGSETCASGAACVSGTPLACGPSTECADAGCDPSTGCVMLPRADGTACNDGDSGTVQDACSAGVCRGIPQVCTNDLDCDDGNVCNGSETCTGGSACSSGVALNCGSSTQCADPSCDATLGCLMLPRPDGTVCNDGDPGTANDRCSAGSCEGSPLACTGNAECDDGNFCNGAEVCDYLAGCTSGPLPDCGTPTQCADPECDPLYGCVMIPRQDGTACDDGNPATEGDSCVSGGCQGGSSGFALHSLTPDLLHTGSHVLLLHGSGFVPNLKAEFEGGGGRRPSIEDMQLLNENTIEMLVVVKPRRRWSSTSWDLVVHTPDGEQIVLGDALETSR